jgi:hypothetical protein
MHIPGREKQALGIAVLVIALYVSPLFVLGPDAHIRVHDNLDSNIAWYRVLLASGTWFGPYDAVIPQVINGLPRGALGTEFSVLIVLHALFPPMTAYAISQAVTRLFAFLGMYWLLRDHWVRDNDHVVIRVGVALAFALTPFWPSGMLSTLGQPLALWALLWIRRGEGRSPHWLTLLLLPLYSSLVLGFFFFLSAMGLFWLWDALRRKRWNLPFLAAIALMSILYLCVEYRLLLSLLLSEAPTSRNEFVSSKLPMWRSVRLTFKNFVMGHTHVKTLHTAIILPVTGIAFYLCIGLEKWRRGPHRGVFITLFAISLILSGWYAFWFYEGWQPLKEQVALLNTFNFARYHFLRPFLIYLSFALACLLFVSVGGQRGKGLSYAAIVGQIVLLCLNNEEIVYRNKPSFREFYAEEQFQEIAAYIGRPFPSYRVVSLGLHPAVAQYNGFYTLDTYNNFYPLPYKHAFREIIAAELRKNKKLRTYFDTWGGRCYLFADELGKKYDYRKTSKKTIHALDVNMEAFRSLGGTYVLSAVRIENANETGLRLLETFEHHESAWRVFLYEAQEERMASESPEAY